MEKTNINELLANALIEDIKQFISNFQDEINEYCHFTANAVTISELKKQAWNIPLDKIDDSGKNTLITRAIGNNKYQNTIYEAITIYWQLCKEFKLKKQLFHVKNDHPYHKNKSGLSVVDFVKKSKKPYDSPFLFVKMDETKRAAIASDTNNLMLSPSEYNQKSGLFDLEGNEAYCTAKFPKIDFLLEKDYAPFNIIKDLKNKAKYALIKFRDAQKRNEAANVFICVGELDTHKIFIDKVAFDFFKKSSFDGWKVAYNFNAIPILRKDFEDGTTILLSCRNTEFYEDPVNQNFFLK